MTVSFGSRVDASRVATAHTRCGGRPNRRAPRSSGDIGPRAKPAVDEATSRLGGSSVRPRAHHPGRSRVDADWNAFLSARHGSPSCLQAGRSAHRTSSSWSARTPRQAPLADPLREAFIVGHRRMDPSASSRQRRSSDLVLERGQHYAPAPSSKRTPERPLVRQTRYSRDPRLAAARTREATRSLFQLKPPARSSKRVLRPCGGGGLPEGAWALAGRCVRSQRLIGAMCYLGKAHSAILQA